MTGSLGLSIGTTNLVAAPGDAMPIVRRAVLTMFPHRVPEVGVPSENPRLDERGLVITGFVERVGDPVPMVASDGTAHRGEQLVAQALEAMTRTACPSKPPAKIVATVPAHWRDATIATLTGAIADRPVLCPQGQPMRLVSDSVAALTAMRAQPGLPARGIIALCDLGAAGTSITLADAGAGFSNIAPTVRYEVFSGDQIDQILLRQVLTDLNVDPSATSAVTALGRVREQCRIAKEQLSLETATGFTGPLPGAQQTVRLTRGELESALREPLDGFIAVLADTLERNGLSPSNLAALVTVGGGARIPVVTQRLSEEFRMPVTTSAQAKTCAAAGAELLSKRRPRSTPRPGSHRPARLFLVRRWPPQGRQQAHRRRCNSRPIPRGSRLPRVSMFITNRRNRSWPGRRSRTVPRICSPAATPSTTATAATDTKSQTSPTAPGRSCPSSTTPMRRRSRQPRLCRGIGARGSWSAQQWSQSCLPAPASSRRCGWMA